MQNDAKLIREQVFIQEQNIAAEDEWDEQDEIAKDLLKTDALISLKQVKLAHVQKVFYYTMDKLLSGQVRVN